MAVGGMRLEVLSRFSTSLCRQPYIVQPSTCEIPWTPQQSAPDGPRTAIGTRTTHTRVNKRPSTHPQNNPQHTPVSTYNSLREIFLHCCPWRASVGATNMLHALGRPAAYMRGCILQLPIVLGSDTKLSPSGCISPDPLLYLFAAMQQMQVLLHSQMVFWSPCA
jgi:hypothetical protein